MHQMTRASTPYSTRPSPQKDVFHIIKQGGHWQTGGTQCVPYSEAILRKYPQGAGRQSSQARQRSRGWLFEQERSEWLRAEEEFRGP